MVFIFSKIVKTASATSVFLCHTTIGDRSLNGVRMSRFGRPTSQAIRNIRLDELASRITRFGGGVLAHASHLSGSEPWLEYLALATPISVRECSCIAANLVTARSNPSIHSAIAHSRCSVGIEILRERSNRALSLPSQLWSFRKSMA